jgi:Zn-dependent protease
MILLTGFGWAKPVPVNPYRMNLSARTGMALSALAGPGSNFLTALFCAVPFRLGLMSVQGEGFSLATLLFAIAQVSLGLALFNMLPFYPLDGEKVLVGVLPRDLGDQLLDFRPFSPYVLMAVLFILPRLGLDIIGGLYRSVLTPLTLLLFFS